MTATSAPCCAANAWSNGLCASASMPRARVEAAVAARTTRPMMTAWSLRPPRPPRAARKTALMAAPRSVSEATVPVGDVDDPPGVPVGELGAVRDDDQRLPLGVEVKEQAADLVAGGGVDRAGRLVGQQQRRPVDQRPGDRDALPLAARQPGRVGVAPVRDPQRVQQLLGALPRVAGLGPGELGGQQHVVERRHVVEQVEELEDHADLAAAEPGRAGLAEHVDPLVADPDRARWSAGPSRR